MDKLLTESGLKAVLTKHKVKDNGLGKALAGYEKLDDGDHQRRLDALAQISKLADALESSKETGAIEAVADYLDDLMDAADEKKKELTKAKSDAAKTAAHKNHDKDDDDKDDDKKDDKDEADDDEKEEGEYGERLAIAFKKLQSLHGEPMQFIVCEARPFLGLTIARRISAKHREELTKVTGGSRHFLQIGECRFVDGKYIFSSEQNVPGLAKRLQKAARNFTGKKYKITHGDETVEEDDESPDQEAGEQAEENSAAKPGTPEQATAAKASAPADAAAVKPESPMLANAPDEWHAMRQDMEKRLNQLRSAVLKELAEEGPEFVAQITRNMKRFDAILDTLDHRLAESLAKAHAAPNAAARHSELMNSKAILMEYLKFVKAEESLLAHIDANPFGVEMNLHKTLTTKLTHMAQAIR